MKYRLVLVLFFVAMSVIAQDAIPNKPNPPRLVNDLTESTLSANESRRLENKLLNYEDSTSTQVAIAIVSTIRDYEVVDFAQRTADKWGIGQKGKNNGVFILVSINDRKAAIVTGYGMEGSIPDAATFTIREDFMNPKFRSGDFYGGLDDATTVIMKLASGEFKADQLGRRRRNADGEGSKGFPFGFLFIIFFFIIPAIFGKRRGRNSMGGRSFPWWVFLLGGGSNHRGNNFDNFRGGGGGFGGGGGGFGGFGGGGFGGGGSGGSW